MKCGEIKLRAVSVPAVHGLIEEGIEPLVARVLAARGVEQRCMMSPPLADLPAPRQLPGVTELVERLADVCEKGESLCVFGDYDVDGMTATVIAYRCLRALGADVRWYVPSRDDGYGFSVAAAEQQAAAGVKHLLLVDNGITAHEGIAAAARHGLRVYVIDHHQPDARENGADCMVNPQVNNGGEAAFNSLVAAALVFYVMKALCRRLPQCGFVPANELDLVALATLADCADMNTVNRALVSRGLTNIQNGKTRPGIVALAEVLQLPLAEVNSHAAVFRLIPRLNAAARVETPEMAMRCLLAEDEEDAKKAAARLDQLNRRRLSLQKEMVGNARIQAQEAVCRGSGGLVLYHEDWHPGIVGIIAGKLAEEFKCPTVALAACADGSWRGSGRAATVDLIAVLSDIAARKPDILLNQGGHRRAAGMRVSQAGISTFRELFADACVAAQQDLPPLVIEVDALSTDELTVAALQQLNTIVWGSGFPQPCFAGTFSVLQRQPLSGGYLRLRVAEHSSGNEFSAMYFGGEEMAEDERLQLLYRAEIDKYAQKPKLIIESILSAATVDDNLIAVAGS